MNLNIIGYAVYLAISAVIIVKAGKVCYRNGNVFVARLYPGHEAFSTRLNGLLLLGYYLLNLGYCGLAIAGWETIGTIGGLVEAVSAKTAFILCVIAAMHYLNILWIAIYLTRTLKTNLWKPQKS